MSNVRVDRATLTKDFVYYAQVLVDIVFSKPILEQVLVETEDTKSWQDIGGPNMQKCCNHCEIVGHTISECRKARSEVRKEKNKILGDLRKAIRLEETQTLTD